MVEMSYQQVWKLVKRGELRGNSPYCGLRCRGKILVFQVASRGLLPADFEGWHWWVNRSGTPLAHRALWFSKLPKTLDLWYFADQQGTLSELAELLCYPTSAT